jgi:acetylornithine aminotransferase
MLGTTFGGNYLACVAGIAVLDIMKKEELVKNAFNVGSYLLEKVSGISGIKLVQGRGLMIGLEFEFKISEVRKRLLFEERIFTGVTGTNTIRILPPLAITKSHIDQFINSLRKVLN